MVPMEMFNPRLMLFIPPRLRSTAGPNVKGMKLV